MHLAYLYNTHIKSNCFVQAGTCTVILVCQGGKPDTGKMHIGMNVCGSAYENGCMVDGMCATAVD